MTCWWKCLLRFVVTLVVALAIVLSTRVALADVFFQAPAGARAFPLGAGRVLCGTPPQGWAVESGGRAVRPPSGREAVGRVEGATIAASPADCAKASTKIRLVATGKIPVLDRTTVAWYVDEGRVEADGSSLDGSLVSWPVPTGLEADTCSLQKPTDGPTSVKPPAGHCIWSVGRSMSTDPASTPIRVWPAGAIVATESFLFDAEGRPVSVLSLTLSPRKVEVASFVKTGAAVDVSQGFGLLPLLHPEAASAVECRGATCRVEGGQLRVQAPPEGVVQFEARFSVAAGVSTSKPGPIVVKVAVLRCPMDPVSGAVFRGVPSSRVIVKLGGACAKDVDSLRFLVGARAVDVAEQVSLQDTMYVVLAIGSVDASTLALTAVRSGADGAVVAAARIDARVAPTPRSALDVAGYSGIEFVPYNRDATVHFPSVSGGELVLLPVDGVYSVERKNGVTTVRGDPNAAGLATFQFAYRVTTLPKPLSDIDLALFSDPIQRAVKLANEPAPFDVSATTASPLAELVCADENGKLERIVPGVQARLSFGVRDGCRLIIHRERIGPEYGAQKLRVEVEVRQLDGTLRADASVNDRVVLRHGNETKISWIKGVQNPYDRVIVRLTHEGDETHYLGGESLLNNAPAVQWSMLFGTGRVRIYATSAIPTGLYRFGGTRGTGALALSFGVISRLTWLNRDGKEGLLGAEAGVMAFGVTGDTSTTGGTLTQVGAVLGIGLAIPIANASQATQASINLHGWFEQRLSGGGSEKGPPNAFIFGPSISFGNIGGTL